MRFNIAKDELTNVLNTVSKGMSSRSTLPILAGILITAENDEVSFQTTDLEISVRHTVNADVQESGKTVIPGKLFGDIVKALPDAAVLVETNNEQVKIACLESSFTLSTLNPVDFPYFPQVEVDTSVTLPSQKLAALVKKVGKGVSRDESRAVLTGILFSVEDDQVRLVATDSYRLAVGDLILSGQQYDPFQAIIPGRVFEDVSRLAVGYDEVTVAFSENQVVFSFGSTVFVSRKIEGTYPNYNQLLPKECATTVQLPCADLVTAVKRVSLLAQAHTPVRFAFSSANQTVTITAKTQDVGGAQEVLPVQVQGDDIEIAFNHQYLLDGLGSIEGDAIIQLQTALKPGILKGAEDESFLYLAMPVRLG